MDINTLDKLFSDSGHIKTRKLMSNEYVFYQGDIAQNIFAIKKGQIRLERPTIEGRSVTMHVANVGESFAEAALFSEVYHCNAISTTTSTIHVYSKNQILDALRCEPDKAEKYIAHLSSQVRSLRTRLELRNILSARERILQYLLLVANLKSREVSLDRPLKEIAEELGLAQETFYRELSKMNNEGVIKRNKNKITL